MPNINKLIIVLCTIAALAAIGLLSTNNSYDTYNLNNSIDKNNINFDDEEDNDDFYHRLLSNTEYLDYIDYYKGKFDIPKWLKRRNLESRSDVHQIFENVITASQNDNTRTLLDTPQQTLPYNIENAIEITKQFSNMVGILLYRPNHDDFILYYNIKRHGWVSGCVKLSMAFKHFSMMLRHEFKDRFRGVESDELAIVIGGGDYPHLHPDCLENFPYTSPKCSKNDTPILQFGSAFSYAQSLPNMIPMPMTATHLPCLRAFGAFGKVCADFSPKGHDDVPGKLVFGDEFGLNFEDLIPQVVWRGTDFNYLAHIESLRKPNPQEDIVSFTNPARAPRRRDLATLALRQVYDDLLPRWKGAVLTAEAEILAAKDDTLPWANMKFTSTTPAAKAKAKAAFEQLDEYVSILGERMSSEELAKYKYHIDLGGGGGTTWTGTLAKMAMPGLLFHHVTPTKDYIHDYKMKPWIHYVPIKADLSDLKEKFDWAESHPTIAKMIADQATKLMRHLSTSEGFGEMYQEVFVDQVRQVIDAYQPVSVTHPGLSWEEVLKNYDGGDSFDAKWMCSSECVKNPTDDELAANAVVVVPDVVSQDRVLSDQEEHQDCDVFKLLAHRRDCRRKAARQAAVLLEDRQLITQVQDDATEKKDAVLTSWYTYQLDPQRHKQVLSDSIEYINDIYLSATHLKIPLVVFHDNLSDEFVKKYENDYVSFKRVTPNPQFSTNDFRFVPYLEYIIENGLHSVLMVDASDVFFNSNPFDYIHEHEDEANQLFVSHDNGGTFGWHSWKVPGCYGEVAHTWPPKQHYNAGVWGGKGPAVQCILECINNQIQNHMPKGHNCNMPVVNWCLNHGPCNAQIHPEPPEFVNPWRGGCREKKYPVIHNKCADTQEGQTRIDIINNEVSLVDTGIKFYTTADYRKAERKKITLPESKPLYEGEPSTADQYLLTLNQSEQVVAVQDEPWVDTLWIDVTGYTEGISGWKVVLLEVLTVVSQIPNAVLVEPCMMKGVLRSCSESYPEGIVGEPVPVGDIYDLSKYFMSSDGQPPTMATYDEYLRRNQVGVRPSKQFPVCFKGNPNPCPAPYIPFTGHVEDGKRIRNPKIKGEVIQSANNVDEITTLKVHVCWWGRCGLELQKLFLGNDRPDFKNYDAGALQLNPQLFDTVQNVLATANIADNFSVIHWRAEKPRLDYLGCTEHVLDVKRNIENTLSNDPNHKFFLMSSLDKDITKMWNGEKQLGSSGSPSEALDILESNGLLKFDQLLKESNVYIKDPGMLAIYDLILAKLSKTFSTCAADVEGSPSSCTDYQRGICSHCNYLGKFARLAIDTRLAASLESNTCWPVEEVEVAPNAAVPQAQDDDVSIHYFIKSSGNEPYIQRALDIADTWAKDVEDITFLMDNTNHDKADLEYSTRPWAKVRHVEGTDKQGDYKHASGRDNPILLEAYAAQRLKTRAVFAKDLNSDAPRTTSDWTCYLDDDMVVNHANLKAEVLKKEPTCSPNCIIGDMAIHAGIPYTGGGWCMEQKLVERIATLFKEKTDEEIGWHSTDDVDFHHAVLNKALGVEMIDSELFFSELAWRKKSEKRLKYGLGMSLIEFGEKVVPSLAVYHTSMRPSLHQFHPPKPQLLYPKYSYNVN